MLLLYLTKSEETKKILSKECWCNPFMSAIFLLLVFVATYIDSTGSGLKYWRSCVIMF